MSTYKLAAEFVQEGMMRDAYCQTMINLAKEDERVVMLDADLMSSMGTAPFLKEFPERTFNVGVQEANMIGMAAGMNATGLIPYAHTFGPFASRRCFDQLFLSIAYTKASVRVIGSDPGITAAFNGGTHMPFEDYGIIRNIPEATILEPVDATMLSDLLTQSKERPGLTYIRLLRKNAIKIYEDGSTFEIGKGATLIEGSDVTIIATGIMVKEALDAAEMLKAEGISAKVVNMFTIKPIDKELVIACAKETGALVTAENHSIINGLGSAVSEVLTDNKPVPLERVGVKDLFGEVGPVDYLRERFELRAEDIVAGAKKAIARK